MANKNDLIFELNKLLRRTQFRSDSWVKSSLFFHVIFSVLTEMSGVNEEDLEEKLGTGDVKFVSFQPPYKCTMTVELRKVE